MGAAQDGGWGCWGLQPFAAAGRRVVAASLPLVDYWARLALTYSFRGPLWMSALQTRSSITLFSTSTAAPPQAVLGAISVEKDVDGFHPLNIGRLAMKGREPLFTPCTPLGCMVLLER